MACIYVIVELQIVQTIPVSAGMHKPASSGIQVNFCCNIFSSFSHFNGINKLESDSVQ